MIEMAVPNQRIIYIMRNSEGARQNFFKIGHKQLDKAVSDLNANTFKLYVYLANNKDNYRLELSSKHFILWSGTSDSTYDRAFKELIEKGYLIEIPNKKRQYFFVEESKTYDKRHKEDKIIIQDEEDMKEIFNSLDLN